MNFAKAVSAAEICNTIPFIVFFAKIIPEDESFPGNVRRLREESDQIYLSGVPFVQRAKLKEDGDATTAASQGKEVDEI